MSLHIVRCNVLLHRQTGYSPSTLLARVQIWLNSPRFSLQHIAPIPSIPQPFQLPSKMKQKKKELIKSVWSLNTRWDIWVQCVLRSVAAGREKQPGSHCALKSAPRALSNSTRLHSFAPAPAPPPQPPTSPQGYEIGHGSTQRMSSIQSTILRVHLTTWTQYELVQ